VSKNRKWIREKLITMRTTTRIVSTHREREREKKKHAYTGKRTWGMEKGDHLRCLDISVRNSAARLPLRGIICRKPQMQNPQTSPRPKLTKRKKHYTRHTPTHFLQTRNCERERERERERLVKRRTQKRAGWLTQNQNRGLHGAQLVSRLKIWLERSAFS
jgi:hypothetical protein